MPDLEVARLEPLSASHRRQLWHWIGNREWFEKAGRAFAETLQAKGAVTMSTAEIETRYVDWKCARPECALDQTTPIKGPLNLDVRIAACARCRTLVRFTPSLSDPEAVVPLTLIGPNNEYATVGPIAARRMNMPPAIETPRLPPSDGAP